MYSCLTFSISIAFFHEEYKKGEEGEGGGSVDKDRCFIICACEEL